MEQIDVEKLELEHTYQKCLDYLRCGAYSCAYKEVDKYSIEELEALANFGWSDSIGEELYSILMRCRKGKLNEQFFFNEKSIQAIIELDQKLKACCRKLKEDVKGAFSQMIEQERKYFCVQGYIKIDGANSFVDCGLSVLDEGILQSCYLNRKNKIEDVNLSPMFDFQRNYAEEIFSHDTRQAMKAHSEIYDCHIGYAFRQLYQNSCLSLQDMLEIKGISGAIHISYSTEQ